MIEVRPARPDEAEAAARCHSACIREGYAELLSVEELARTSGDLRRRVRIWESMIASGPGPLLAVEGDEIIGIARAGKGRDDDLDLELELILIYARQAYWGQGVGHRLLEAATGDRAAYLWVFRDNESAVRFYRRHGFGPDGTAKINPRFGLPELRMVRPPLRLEADRADHGPIRRCSSAACLRRARGRLAASGRSRRVRSVGLATDESGPRPATAGSSSRSASRRASRAR